MGVRSDVWEERRAEALGRYCVGIAAKLLRDYALSDEERTEETAGLAEALAERAAGYLEPLEHRKVKA